MLIETLEKETASKNVERTMLGGFEVSVIDAVLRKTTNTAYCETIGSLAESPAQSVKDKRGPDSTESGVSATQLISTIITTETPENVAWFLKSYATELQNEAYEHVLLGALASTDSYIRLKAGEILANVYSQREASHEFHAFIADTFESASCPRVLNQAMIFLQVILRQKRVKNIYINEEFIQRLHAFIEKKELRYNSLIVAWMLSFEKRALPYIEDSGISLTIHAFIKERSKEKILRLCYLILINLYKFGFKFSIIDNNVLLHNIDYIYERTSDDGLKQDLDTLRNHLLDIQKRGSSLESYLAELFENKLDDTVCHTSAAFWITNANALRAKKVEIIKALKKYLKSQNTKFICLAANDIHMFVKYVSDVYYYVEKFKIKDDLVGLSLSDNSDVKFYSTKALSTCIFVEWS